MSATIADISWPVLRRIVRQWGGDAAEPAELEPLDGGSISTTVKITTTNGLRAVLKISPHRVDRSYAREAFHLNLLRQLGLPVPQVYDARIGSLEEPFSYLLMEWIEGGDLSSARRACDAGAFDTLQEEFAEIVHRLHACHGPGFGRVEPPQNGTAPDQASSQATHDDGATASADLSKDWPAYFRELHEPIWQEARKLPILHVKERKLIDKLHERLERFLPADCPAALTHWDLWSNNVLALGNGDGRWHIAALLDPMCTWADAEAELAYLDLYQTITPAFMKVYQRDGRLGDDYHKVRKPIYQLYALLGHALVHGVLQSPEHLMPLQERIERVAAFV
jgi:fructosamine-3-kinase